MLIECLKDRVRRAMIWNRKRIVFSLFFIALFSLTSLEIMSQSLRNIEKKGIRHFENANYVKARDHFLVLYDSGWNENSTCSYLAECYIKLHEPEKSYQLLSKLSHPNQENLYLMILSSYYSENFQDADSLMKSFSDSSFDVQSIKDRVQRTLTTYENSMGFTIQNFGEDINTKNREYSAVMYNDYNSLLFTSRNEQSTILDIDGLAYESIYSTSIDSTNNWEKPIPLKTRDNQGRSHDATVQVYASGTKMISYNDGRLYTSFLKDGVWSEESDLTIPNFGEINTHCYITPDEQTIFFASDYLSVGEDLDLFVSRKNEDGNWSEPKPLDVLNTDFDEDSPFLASDSTFYFSSRGHNSMGGYDIFKSTFDHDKNKWSAPENLGHPINTVAEDTYYTTDGKLGYLSSTRPGGYGSLDLYRVFLFNKVKIGGILYDRDQQPIPHAEIDIKYDSTYLTSFTDKNGYYEMFVPICKNMRITFIKDSLNLYEGDYVVNIFFRDKNNNEFNLFIDYSSTEPNKSKNEDNVVKHINIEVRNDNTENLIIASTPIKQEKAWSDSINAVIEKNKSKEFANGKNQFIVDMHSTHLSIKRAIIRNKGLKEDVQAEKKTEKGYTVQILAMPVRREPDYTFFDKLDGSVVNDRDGKDGLKRFYLGEYAKRKDAIKAMRALRKIGYDDAFIRKLETYSKL